MPKVLVNSIPTKNVTAAVLLQQLKFDSIANKKDNLFFIKNGVINQRHAAPFGDCELRWSPQSFQSGTCRNNQYRLTIMAIVGDIGYPW